MNERIVVTHVRPRCLSRDEAARYVGIGASAFAAWVENGVLPKPLPISGVEIYDTHAIDRCRRAGLPQIYVIGFGRYVKIGWSRFVTKRVADIECGLPDAVTVHHVRPGEQRDERALHRRFAHLRLRGEWFRREGELDAWIEARCP